MIREKLPEENYELFKYLVEFLVKVCFFISITSNECNRKLYIWDSLQVMDCEDLNKMTSSNLAIVFGPNLIWSPHANMSLEEINPINAFVDFVLQNHRDIYLVDVNQKHTPVE